MRESRNQRYFILNGAFWSIYNALTFGFISVFALALGASNLTIGILGSMPFVAAIFSQIPGAKITEYFSRKRIYVLLTIFSRLTWIFILVIPFFFNSNPFVFLVLFFFATQFLEYLVDPAWASLAGDVVPDRIRGKFFGKRQLIKSFLWMVAILFGGIYLDLFQNESLFGFSTMFFAGILFGLSATWALSRIKEPDTMDHNHHHKLKEFFTFSPTFKRFCIAVFFFNFAYMIASPFFVVYMLKNLEMSYTFYVVSFSLTILSRIIAEKHIGRISDKYGDKTLAMISMFGTALVPLIFIFITKQTIWLIVPAQILAGYVWGGAELTIFNLLLDLTDKKERPVQVAEYNLITSIPLVVSPILGGLLADKVIVVLSGIPLVFAISCILRMLSPFFLRGLKEPRAKKEYPFREILKDSMTFHPAKGAQQVIRVISRKIKNRKDHNGIKENIRKTAKISNL